MEAFNKRIEETLKSGIIEPLYKNDWSSIVKIRKEIQENPDRDYKEDYDIVKHCYAGNSTREPWTSYETKFTYFYKNNSGEEVRYFYDTKTGISELVCKNAKIVVDIRGKIEYYLDTEKSGDILLGSVSQEEVSFPRYGDTEPLQVAGELPLEELENTSIDTIAKMVRNHPVMSKYADMILDDFNQILSIDEEREITTISEEAKVNAILKSENSRLEEENSQQKTQIGKLQAMLNRTLTFAKGVRDSFVGKIFFKNKIAQLNLADDALPAVGDTTIGKEDAER